MLIKLYLKLSKLFTFLLLCSMQVAKSEPVVLPNSEVFEIKSKNNQVEYKIMVGLPKTYHTEDTKYDVIYLLDAHYSFPLFHSIVDHLSDREKAKKVIVVGIGYKNHSDTVTYHDTSVISPYKANRTRDYTPIKMKELGYEEKYKKFSGQASAFKDFIKEELIPVIQKQYRATKERTIVGHSYGGLFAFWIFLTDFKLFKNYIAVSPSLWYEDEWILTKLHKLKHNSCRRLHISVGLYESERMQLAFKKMEKEINKRKDDCDRISINWMQDDHFTIFPKVAVSSYMYFYGIR